MPPRGRSDPGHGSGPSRYPGTFHLAFCEAAAALNWQVVQWRGDIVTCSDVEGREHVVGVDNLYRRARLEPRAEWLGLISGFLSTLQTAERAEFPSDLAGVADRLLVRVGRAFTALPDGTTLWSEPLGETGLGVNLVIDAPNTMSYVTDQMVLDSGRTGADWVGRALDNLSDRTPADCLQPVHTASGIMLCNVADAYDSSRVLLLDRLLPDAGQWGAFVVLPGRDELLVLKVSAEALPHVHLLKVLAEKNFKNAPYPISDEVYWIRGGAWHPFPIHLRGKEVRLHPPPAFVEVLEALSPDEKAGEDDSTELA